MRLDYLHGIGEPVQRRLDGVQELLSFFRKPQLDIDALLQESANQIAKHLMIDGVSIGLKDSKDGLYRYKAMAGMRSDAEATLKGLEYRKEQFYNNSEYRGTDISKQTRLYLAEDNAPKDSEEKSFNRPGLLAAKRMSDTESLEGDYLDVMILGPFDDMLGWIEISGTRTRQLPDATSIRWVELIASIIGAAVTYKTARG